MQNPPTKLKTLEPNPTASLTPTGIDTEKPVAMPQPSPADEEQFLPFGKAAKAIFVKANGLPAYYKSTGSFRYTR